MESFIAAISRSIESYVHTVKAESQGGVGGNVEYFVGIAVGRDVGRFVGNAVGFCVGAFVGLSVGVGVSVGLDDDFFVGEPFRELLSVNPT